MTGDPAYMHQVLQPADYVRKPWKNGGGVALDLHVEPAGAGMDAFDWRASIALVHARGPFSHFPGVDRTIVLLAGTGMRLDSATWHADMTTLFEPVHFPGEMAISCTLTNGPTRDFNLMVRRDVARAQFNVVRQHAMTLSVTDATLCYVATGAVDVVMATGTALRVNEDCTWIGQRDGVDDGNDVRIMPAGDNAVALVATMHRIAP